MEVATFTLANESFSLGTSVIDNERRKRHYMGSQSDGLTEQEQKILTSLGIDGKMEKTLKPYMAKFFEKLPVCNTDASLRLSKDCEVPYYVVWSTLFANRAETSDRFNKNRKLPSRSQLNVAHDGAIIQELKQRPGTTNKYEQIFTLIPAAPVGLIAAPISSTPAPAPTTTPKPTIPAPFPPPSAPPVEEPIVTPNTQSREVVAEPNTDLTEQEKIMKLFTLIPKPELSLD